MSRLALMRRMAALSVESRSRGAPSAPLRVVNAPALGPGATHDRGLQPGGGVDEAGSRTWGCSAEPESVFEGPCFHFRIKGQKHDRSMKVENKHTLSIDDYGIGDSSGEGHNYALDI